MRTHRIINLVICVVSLCSAGVTLAGPAPLDADNVGQALGMVSLDQATKEETRKFCDGLLPTDKFVIDYYFYKWTRDNATELAAIQVFEETDEFKTYKSVLDAGVGVSLGAVKIFSEEKQKQYCANYVSELKDGNLNLSVYTPKASEYLVGYSKRHPLTSDEQGDNDFKAGCIAKYLNAHGDYDVAVSTCACTLKVVKTELTPEETTEALAVEAKKGDVKNLPQMRRIAPDIQKCATNGQN